MSQTSKLASCTFWTSLLPSLVSQQYTDPSLDWRGDTQLQDPNIDHNTMDSQLSDLLPFSMERFYDQFKDQEYDR
jgi:hypothetical protein